MGIHFRKRFKLAPDIHLNHHSYVATVVIFSLNFGDALRVGMNPMFSGNGLMPFSVPHTRGDEPSPLNCSICEVQ